ncbi:MAG TPA: cyclic nucleotide-binding domain-containing protein [Solimonas sp.]|nr:cyclic nucleotide-binding domain-containing protein [Solimonas sp.]
MSTDKAVDPSIFANYVPLNALRPESRGDLARKSIIRAMRSGEYLFKIGEDAKNAMFLISGEIHLEDVNGKAIARLRAGDPTAHHRIAHQSPRKVSARAHGNIEVMTVDAGLLDVMLTWDQTGSFEVGELQSGGDSGSSDDWMSKLLQMRTFQMVPPSNLQAMFMRMQEVKMEPGQVMVKQGEDGDYFYAIMSGRCIVTREQPNQKPIRLAELETGSCFGEEALISDAKRNATVTALTRGSLMRLSKDDFRKLLNDPLSRKISLLEAQKLVDSGKARWLDVRLPSEFQAHSLKGSLNLPLYMLRMKLNMVEPGVTWIVCCDTGRRSSVAVFILTQKGYDAYVLDKGIPPAA